MDKLQKCNQIFQALNMREEKEGVIPGTRYSVPSITGDDRQALIKELVRLLTEEEITETKG